MTDNDAQRADTPQILVIDDTPANLRLMTNMLSDHGYQVRAAPSGHLALKTVAIELPDLILLDVKMPDMDGYEVCRRLKSDDRTRMIPVIFISALDEVGDKVKAFQAGGVDYVTKPFQREEVLARVGTHLGLRHLQMHMEELVRQRTAELEDLNRALRESEEKYRTIFEDALEGIFQANTQGQLLNVNPALARMHGYESPREMIEAITDIDHQVFANAEHAEKFKAILEKDGTVKAFEMEAYDKKGGKIWVSITARCVRDADGKTVYYEGMSENITERRQVEEERARLKLQLLQAQKMEALGQLAGGVAHDFNNILTALIGYGNLLRMRMESSNPLRDYVDQILTSSEKAANLTQSLLAFGRKQAIELKPRNVNAVIKGVEKLLKRLLTEDIELKVSLADKTTVSVMADITQLDQVLLNLATNARDAMPKGGLLRIETRVVASGDKSGAGEADSAPEEYVCISVSDTGCGMDEKTREKIFEPFFTTKEPGRGTGLGLSIVYGVVKQHNGYIDVQSESGRGTTFHVYLPAVKTMEETAERTFFDAKGGDETILVADDNHDLRTLIKQVLALKGYSVVEAVDGNDVVVQFLEHQDKIALLILDVVMPKKTAMEAYEEIREMNQDIKVIFMSGYTGDIVLDKGVRNEGIDFISKPVSPNELLLKVREVLSR